MDRHLDEPKGYRIFRKPDQADDSLDSFEWQPPKESDELYEALKSAFPKGTTHRYRMRDALIDFLLQERETERESQRISIPTAKSTDHGIQANTSGGRPKLQQNSPRGSETKSQEPVHEGPTPPPAKTPDGSSPASRKKKTKDWDNMTVVWTSESGLARAPRPKRTMTEEERREYQLRRVRGACVSCKKRKRKCNHDLPHPNSGPKDDRDSPKPDPTAQKGRLNRPAEATRQVTKKSPSGSDRDTTDSSTSKHHSSFSTMFTAISPHIKAAKNVFHNSGNVASTDREMTSLDFPDLSSDSWTSPGASVSLPESSQSPPSSVSILSPSSGDFGYLNGADWMYPSVENVESGHLKDTQFHFVENQNPGPVADVAGNLAVTSEDTALWWHSLVNAEPFAGAEDPTKVGGEIERAVPFGSTTSHTSFKLPIGGSVLTDWWEDALMADEATARNPFCISAEDNDSPDFTLGGLIDDGLVLDLEYDGFDQTLESAGLPANAPMSTTTTVSRTASHSCTEQTYQPLGPASIPSGRRGFVPPTDIMGRREMRALAQSDSSVVQPGSSRHRPAPASGPTPSHSSIGAISPPEYLPVPLALHGGVASLDSISDLTEANSNHWINSDHWDAIEESESENRRSSTVLPSIDLASVASKKQRADEEHLMAKTRMFESTPESRGPVYEPPAKRSLRKSADAFRDHEATQNSEELPSRRSKKKQRKSAFGHGLPGSITSSAASTGLQPDTRGTAQLPLELTWPTRSGGPAPQKTSTPITQHGQSITKKPRRRSLVSVVASLAGGSRGPRKAAEAERRSEVQEYGFNPNQQPVLLSKTSVEDMETGEDGHGYRGWGTMPTKGPSNALESHGQARSRHAKSVSRQRSRSRARDDREMEDGEAKAADSRQFNIMASRTGDVPLALTPTQRLQYNTWSGDLLESKTHATIVAPTHEDDGEEEEVAVSQVFARPNEESTPSHLAKVTTVAALSQSRRYSRRQSEADNAVFESGTAVEYPLTPGEEFRRDMRQTKEQWNKNRSPRNDNVDPAVVSDMDLHNRSPSFSQPRFAQLRGESQMEHAHFHLPSLGNDLPLSYQSTTAMKRESPPSLQTAVQTRIIQQSQKSSSNTSNTWRNIVKKVAKTKTGSESTPPRLSASSESPVSGSISAMSYHSSTALPSPTPPHSTTPAPPSRARARFSMSRKKKEVDLSQSSTNGYHSAAESTYSRFSASEDEGLGPRPRLSMSSNHGNSELEAKVGYMSHNIAPIHELDEPSYSHVPGSLSYSQQAPAMQMYAPQSMYPSSPVEEPVGHELDDRLISGLSRLEID